MQASLFGDEFWEYVAAHAGGALQRCGLSFWLDAFSVTAPDSEGGQVSVCDPAAAVLVELSGRPRLAEESLNTLNS